MRTPLELSLGEISRRLDVPKSVAHRLLNSLRDLGWAEQYPENGFYRLSLRLAAKDQRRLGGTRIPDICQPILGWLASNTKGLSGIAILVDMDLSFTGNAFRPDLSAGTRGEGPVAHDGQRKSLASDAGTGGSFGRDRYQWTGTDIGGPRVIASKQTLWPSPLFSLMSFALEAGLLERRALRDQSTAFPRPYFPVSGTGEGHCR
ncbi:helix-turn-helix domain-containing protein [Pararhizobium polonicum]|uniref:helix-turn-helix domain-containing protein n=1 Tax=Pararhizobium polonicum TaxID=1612624 RepID=UPI0009F16498